MQTRLEAGENKTLVGMVAMAVEIVFVFPRTVLPPVYFPATAVPGTKRKQKPYGGILRMVNYMKFKNNIAYVQCG